MKQYHDALRHTLENGEPSTDRTGVGTIRTFGYMMRFNLQEGFPAVTTKKLAFNAVKSELLWFIEGSTDERRLCEILYGVRDPAKKTIWTANADAQGVSLGYQNDDNVKELGPIYGHQWRDFNGVDQIKKVISQIKSTPDSRRLIVSAWNPSEIEKMALPPCHVMFQFSVSNGKLSCMLTQRSADLALGSPFNIASYALLTHMVAQVTGLEVGDLVYSIGDAHIYKNQVEQVKMQLEREPLPLPKLYLNPAITDIDDFTMDDIRLEEYQHHPPIEIPFAT